VAGSKSDYLEKALLDAVLGGPAYTKPSIVYIALSTAVYSETATGASFGEVASGVGYARLAVTNDLTQWPAATGTNPTVKANAQAQTFAAATGSWGTVNSFYILDGSGAGANVLYGADLTTPRTVNTGDTASFASGAITIQED
jgi:hypothetical protein